MLAELTTLGELVGRDALRYLRRGGMLQIWRRSEPHNWFIWTKRSEHWHSDCERLRELPDLRLFKLADDSKEHLPIYWGHDSGMPELSRYQLKKQYRYGRRK